MLLAGAALSVVVAASGGIALTRLGGGGHHAPVSAVPGTPAAGSQLASPGGTASSSPQVQACTTSTPPVASSSGPRLPAPTDLGVSVSGTAARLTWSGVALATAYRVTERHVLADGATTHTTSYDLCDLSPHTFYTAKVYAEAPDFSPSVPAVLTFETTAGGASTPSGSAGTSPPALAPLPSSFPGSTACSPGSFPTSFFAPDFVGPPSRTFSQQFIRDEGSYIQTCYPAGSSAPSSGQPGGAQAKLSIAAGPRLSYTLTYQIRFPVGFQWVKGGKLPGLCGGKCWTGSNNGPGGWSTRFMWRAGGVAEVLLSDATTTGYGTDLFRSSGDWSWQADGQWHTISQTVTLNTPGVANGTITVSYDGRQVAQATGITFRAAGDTDEIDSLMFTTFFGGHGPSWAPTSTQEIDFAGFTVS